MKIIEIISESVELDERKKKKRKKVKSAAYGPGPYGMYGTAVGYSGEGGDGGGVGEGLEEHKKGVRARIYNKKPKAYIEPPKTPKVEENFADGKNPQDKGDSKRHGIPKGASISQLKKIRSSDSASPRKKQLAHWQINMRQGKQK
jgi:hypothetical protein